MLVFGWRTALLTLAGAQILVLAAALLHAPVNRLANRFLAALLVVLAGLLTPYAIGFAGFYDAWPWLSFAPFAVPLALGPLVWSYTVALTTGAAPRRMWLHLAPAVAQFAYQSACFLLPLQMKSAWDARGHGPFVDPVVSLGVLVGLGLYCLASLRQLAGYRAWLAGVRSDDSRFAARWLERVLAAVLATLAVWTAYEAWDRLVADLDYFQTLGLNFVLAALGGYLGVEGWRHAGLAFPAMRPATVEPALARDWSEPARRWAERTRAEGWAADPELTLPVLAARLGTNAGHLSRALNEGLGVNFSAFVNGLRCEAVAAAIAAGRNEDLLDLALEAGFASKASFNRAFRQAYGLSPSQYRARRRAVSDVSDPDSSTADTVSRRADD